MGVENSVMLELHEHQVEPGDLYMMCSDGLSDMVADPTIATILQAGLPLPQMATELVAKANENGGRDNITVLLTQVSGTSDKRGLISRLLGK